MSGLAMRWRWRPQSLAWLLADEKVLFANSKLWYFVHSYTPWQIGENWPIPFLVNAAFYATERRALTIVRHCGILNVELSQWTPGVAVSQGTEIISNVRIGYRHFGSVRFDFFGLGRGRFGNGTTGFGPSGEDVPYLEIVSRRQADTRTRTVQLFMGTGEDGKREIELAHKVVQGLMQPEGS